MTFSKDWTDEERLKLIMLIAQEIQSDIPAGRYGAALEHDDQGVPTKFRPNMQSVINIILAPASDLEAARGDLEQFANESCKVAADFYSTPLSKIREELLNDD